MWHPLNSARDEVERWRRRVLQELIVQPFKQAFREVYVLTRAELLLSVRRSSESSPVH